MDERGNGHSDHVEDRIRFKPDGLLELTRIADPDNPGPIVTKSIGPEDQFSAVIRKNLPQNGQTVSITRVRAELPNSSSQ